MIADRFSEPVRTQEWLGRDAAELTTLADHLTGLDTAARKGKYSSRPPVITDDMLHTVLRRRALGESVEQIQPDLSIPTGKREAYPEPVEATHADFAALRQRDRSPV
ncbi:hypothetical protein [Streptomyces sp. NPDC127039]|uniref:hypothetical protein n=1 Tax=Streptomyces sp. NPDC127039 TaxID=3347115 RepID=UPI003655315A